MTLPTKIFHYSKDKIEFLRNDFINSCYEENSMKPNGFWVSIEDDEKDISWFEWCKKEEFRIENLKYKYALKLSNKANILHLKTVGEIEEFTNNYRSDLFFRSKLTYNLSINWKKVKERYDGIIISPYQWDCRLRLNTTWYYPWDCASGCLWNFNKAILKLHSIIDVEALKKKGYQEEGISMDSLLASLVLQP